MLEENLGGVRVTAKQLEKSMQSFNGAKKLLTLLSRAGDSKRVRRVDNSNAAVQHLNNIYEF